MKVTIRGTLTDCPDCGTKHLGVRCGMTYAQRLNSQSLDTLWMPAKNIGRTNYLDTESLKDTFGDSPHEQMMDETHGRGFRSSKEQLSLEDKEFFFSDDD